MDAPVDVQPDTPIDAPPDGKPETLCPTAGHGTKLVKLAAKAGSEYCMDQREVSAGEYQEFLQAKAGDTSGQIPACADNKQWMAPLFEPDAWEVMPWECDPRGFDPVNYPNRAVGCVDWCDAYGYCAWAGKRLCGKIGGGSGSLDTMSDPAASEWTNACTQGGTTKYPWGDTFVPGRCVDATAVAKQGPAALDITDVESSECHGESGGFAQVYDLVGSVQEWAAECTPDNVGCAIHGTGTSSSATVTCDPGVTTANYFGFQLGFRCCSDVITTGP